MIKQSATKFLAEQKQEKIETQFEHRLSEIFEYLTNTIAVRKYDNKIAECSDIDCMECLFQKDIMRSDCRTLAREWLNSEYRKPVPQMTEYELWLLEHVDASWIARNRDGELNMFEKEPCKVGSIWQSVGNSIRIDYEFFQFVQYDDEKPWSIRDLLEQK